MVKVLVFSWTDSGSESSLKWVDSPEDEDFLDMVLGGKKDPAKLGLVENG